MNIGIEKTNKKEIQVHVGGQMTSARRKISVGKVFASNPSSTGGKAGGKGGGGKR